MDNDPEDFYDEEPEDERSAKRARFTERQPDSSPPSDAGYDDTEDFYTTPEQPNIDPSPSSAKAVAASEVDPPQDSIPGLGMLSSSASISNNGEHLHDVRAQPEDKNDHYDDNISQSSSQEMYGNKATTINNHTSAHEDAEGSVRGSENEIRQTAAISQEDEEAQWRFDTSDEEASSDNDDNAADVSKVASSRGLEDKGGSDISSDDSESSESSDDSESSYEPLTLEEQAAILMEGDPDVDDSWAAGRGGPKTMNEIAQQPVKVPEVVVTADMKTPELGVAKYVIDNLLLIQATLSAQTRVLESGSVVCLEDKTVIGAIHDTLGRVEEPHYLVAFSNDQEIKRHNIQPGAKIFYVEQHSTFALTQSLKLMKGSDASNLHDEEVADGQGAFSDDEVEAEFKRQRKRKHKATKSNPPPPSVTHSSSDAGVPYAGTGQAPENMARKSSQPTTSYLSQPTDYPTGTISYDEGPADLEDDDDLYTPLARPDNLLDANSSTRSGPPSHQTPGKKKDIRGRGSGNRRFSQDHRDQRKDRRQRSTSGMGDNQGRHPSDRGNHNRKPPDDRRSVPHLKYSSTVPRKIASALRSDQNPMPHPGPRQVFSNFPHPYQQSPPRHSFSMMNVPAMYTNAASPQEQVGNHSGALSEAFTHGTYINPAFFSNSQHISPVQQPIGSGWGPEVNAYPRSNTWVSSRKPVSYEAQRPPYLGIYGAGNAQQQQRKLSNEYDPQTPHHQYPKQSNEYDPRTPQLPPNFHRKSSGKQSPRFVKDYGHSQQQSTQGAHPHDGYDPTNPWIFSRE